MIREEGARSSLTEITPSLESGVARDINHPGRYQQAGGVAHPSGWVQQGSAVTAGGLFSFPRSNHNLRGPRHGAVGPVKPLDLAKGTNIGRVHL